MINMKERNEFDLIIKDLIDNKSVLEMKNYIQHCNTNCFDHCYNVAYLCYRISKKMKWDYVSAARGAMLHDLFLYDWRLPRKYRKNKKMHAFVHGKIALENASLVCELDEIERDMILNHMWPVTLIIPKSKEGFLLTIIDKYCAYIEIIDGFSSVFSKNYYVKYFYVMFILLFKRF